MKRKLLLLLPILSLLLCIEAFFLNIKFSYEVPNIINSFEDQLEGSTPPPSEEIIPEIAFLPGLIFKISKINVALSYLRENEIPSDGQLEKTIDKLERSLLAIKISAFFWIFVGLLCFSAFISIYMNAWFGPFTGRVLFFLSILIGFQNLTLSVPHMIHIPIYGFINFISQIFFIIIMIWGFRLLGNENAIEKMNFYSLYVASQNNEESNTGKIILPERKLNKPNFKYPILNWILDSMPVKLFLFIFTNQIVRHFIIIIVSGIIIGNIIYIPLFSLQKHYSSQFGFLLFISVIIMCIFYIRNYYIFIKEEGTPIGKAIIISSAFLQFRFLRNVFYFLLSTTGVIFFIIAIFLILSLNTIILKNYDLIDKTLNL